MKLNKTPLLIVTVLVGSLLIYKAINRSSAAVQTVREAPGAPASPVDSKLPLVTWPPKVGQPYPDVEVLDVAGRTVRLSTFKGKVLVIEPVGMNCPACLAWAGAHKVGAFEGAQPQGNVTDMATMFPQYAGGIRLDDPRVVYIQLLLFNMQLKPTLANDVERWTAHFHTRPGWKPVVLAAGPWFLQPERYQASYDLIPGFQLVDKNFVLRSDSTGHNPKEALWSYLLPMVPTLVKDVTP